MQEHIRRAHPNYYIPKLPATEESFLLMVNTPPDQRAHLQTQNASNNSRKNNGPSSSAFAGDAESVLTTGQQNLQIETSMSPMQAPR